MLNNVQLQHYADLAIKVGVNLQKGQRLNINAQIECAHIVRVLAEAAYRAGASEVMVQYADEKLSRINYDFMTVEELEKVPQWQIDRSVHIVDNNYANISVSAGDPNIFAGVDPVKLQRAAQARGKAMKYYREAFMRNANRWLVISVPTQAWAKQVFPNEENAVDRLWDAIAMTMRLNEPDPVAAWQKHIATLTRRADFMNKKDFSYVHLTSKNGTNLKVGLAEGHIWCAAEEKAEDGITFTANMPTEEIFTAPHRLRVDGVVHNALPLVEQGNIIDDFTIHFEKGRVTKFTAKKGQDALSNIINTDEGSHYLGEVALIGKNSPIAQSGIMFYNTLFDENASCHLALGKGYPTTVKNGSGMTKEQLEEIGVNDSLEHCDFMIGTADMNIVGVTKEGKKVQLFVDGEWVI